MILHISVGFGVARSTIRAMPEPQCVGRVTSKIPTLLCIYMRTHSINHPEKGVAGLYSYYSAMKPIKIVGKVGDVSKERFIFNQTAPAPEQICTLKTDIRKEFERLGYDTTYLEFEITELL